MPDYGAKYSEALRKHLIESLQSYQYLNEIKAPASPLQLSEEDKFPNGGK